MIRLLIGCAAIAASAATPAPAKPIGFVLIDVEGRDADFLAKVGIRGAAPMVQAIVKRHPQSVVAYEVIDVTDDEQEARFATLTPAIVPKAGVPASAYILKHRLGWPGIAGTLRYADFTRKPSSPQKEPTGPGVAVDSKAVAVQLSRRPIMYVYAALTRARNYGSRFLVAVYQPETPVELDKLAGVAAYAGAGVR